MKNILTQPTFQFNWRVKTYAPPKRLKTVFFSAILLITSNLAIAQQRLDIQKKDAEVEEVFQYVRSHSNYRFVFDSEAVRKLRPVSIQLKNATITEVLDACLQGTNMSYVIDKNTIIIRLKQQPQITMMVQGTKQVSGTVKGNDGVPLHAVTIHLQGTDLKTITDETGKFSLAYPQNLLHPILRASLVGKKEQLIDVQNSTLEIILEDAMQQLDDVVVTGIFNKSKTTYTGAAKEISAIELQQFKGRNLFVTLGNIDPAFYVVPNNTKGSDPNLIPEVQLRGTSSLPNINQLQDATSANLNAPLVVLDGFETTMRRMMDLDVNEVESITLLKDGSATALYGSRGANGVIVIRTKAPVAGKLRIYYKAGINFNLPDLGSYNLLNASEKLQLEEISGFYNDITLDPKYAIQVQQYYNQILGLVQSGVNTDWLSKPLRTGVDQTHNLRLDGGDNSFRYSIGAAYNDIQGVMKASGRKNFNGSINLSYEYNKLTFRNNTIIGNTHTAESPYGAFSDYVKLNPYWSPYDANGNIVRVFEPFNRDYWSRDNRTLPVPNPLYDATLNNYNTSNTTNITNNLQLEWRPLLGLYFRAGLGLIAENRTSDDFKPANHSIFNDYTGTDIFRKGRYIYGSGKNFGYTGNFTTNYTRLFAQKHNIYLGVSADLAQNNTTGYFFTAEGFPDESVDFLGMALQYQQNGKPNGNESTTRRIGIVSTANYTYANKYIVDLSYRLDGASQFGSNRRFAPFWSAGAAWNLHYEEFIHEHLPAFNHLKLRASYGVTGSTQFSAYQSQSLYQYYMDNRYNMWQGAYQTSIGNPNLSWQSTAQYNAGLEVQLFKGRISFTGDVYQKNTSNLLSSLDLPYSNGFTSYNENIGSLQEKGFELSGSFWIIPSRSSNWSWSITANVAHNRDKITKLSQAMKDANEKLIYNYSLSPNKIIREGASQNTIYVVQSLGIDPSNGKEIFLTKEGDITYEWNARDRVPYGIGTPKYRGNLSTLVRYKTLTFNASFGFRTGGQLYNSTLIEKVEFPDKYFNVDRRVLTDRWAKPGDHSPFKGLNEYGIAAASSRFVQNESTFYLQNININYDMINQAWLQKTGIKTLSVGLNTGELFYFSSIRQERGTAYPFSRQVSINVSALF